MRLPVLALVAVLSCGVTPVSGATEDERVAESLARARELYAAAAYEQALIVLDRLHESARVPSADHGVAEQYRAFCLMALGRTAEAEGVITALVLADPASAPEASVSPRLRAAFSTIRARTLPFVIQRQYDTAKGAFDRREFAVAAVGFAGALRLMADPDAQPALTKAPLSDLKTLAEGFRELSTSASAPAAPPPTAGAIALLQVTQSETRGTPAPPPPMPIYTGDDRDVVAPAIEKQVLPQFPAALTAARAGVLEVVIDERGAVETATWRASINPRYDRMVIDATRGWRYKPAMRAGVPVKYRKLVQIAVKMP